MSVSATTYRPILIAKIQERRIVGVVARSDRVEAKLLQSRPGPPESISAEMTRPVFGSKSWRFTRDQHGGAVDRQVDAVDLDPTEADAQVYFFHRPRPRAKRRVYMQRVRLGCSAGPSPYVGNLGAQGDLPIEGRTSSGRLRCPLRPGRLR